MQKKTTNKKLALTTEVVRSLSVAQLGNVAGGGSDYCNSHGGTCGSACRVDI